MVWFEQSSQSPPQSSLSQSSSQWAIPPIISNKSSKIQVIIEYKQLQQIINSMGNCHKDQQQTVTNFDSEKWSMKQSKINSYCFIMRNNYHPNVRLLKWISSNKKENKILKWRQQKKSQYLVNIYEKGDTRILKHQLNQVNKSNELAKRSYIVTEELIRLKDFRFSQHEAVVIAYKCLLAYEEMIREFGGFIAKQNMIYVNRQGIVKVWINENLANNFLQFPYPAITQQELISSLLHQIFTLSPRGFNSKVYDYIKAGSMNFSEVKKKLHFYIQQNLISTLLCIQKQIFDKTLDGYQKKESKSKKSKKKLDKKEQQQQHSLNRLKFIVAGDQSQSSQNFVKDYSQKSISQQHYHSYRDNAPKKIINQSLSFQPSHMELSQPVIFYPVHYKTIVAQQSFI